MSTTTKKPIKRKRKATLKSVLKEPRSKGPFYDADSPSVLRMGKLDKMFNDFVDENGHQLSRADLISMCEYLAQSEPPTDDPLKQGSMTRWWNSYQSNYRRESLSFQSLCQHADVSVDEFYGKISRLYHYLNKEGAINRLRGALPSVVDKTVELALTAEGAKERELVLKMSDMPGLQPASTNISLNQNLNVANFTAAGVPNFETEQDKMTKVVIAGVKQRVLGQGQQDYIDAVPIRQPESVPVERNSNDTQ